MVCFLDVPRGEVYRYMGLGKALPDENVKSATESIILELSKVASPKYCVKYIDISSVDDTVYLGSISTKSKSLAKHLSGCKDGFLFAATLGASCDRLIEKYSIVSPSKAVIAQAVATAMIEQYADSICVELEAEEQKEGYYLKSRFSPGYGDLSLELQPRIISLLNAEKKIGLCLTDAKLMTPIKSITAIIGKTKEKSQKDTERCEGCTLKNCAFCSK